MPFFLRWTLVLISSALISAAPASRALDLVRAGNEAFARGDFALAVDRYNQAEERITDPGLVAFNQAAALYRLGRYREAELYYLRCREDAIGERLTRLLYNLGTTVLLESRGSDARWLDRAIAYYEECLRQEPISLELLEDVQTNLKMARQLRLQAKEKPPESPNPDSKQPEENDDAKSRNQGGFEPERGSLDAKGQRRYGPNAMPGEKGPQGTEQQAPGTGNLPPIPDDEKLLPLPPADAEAYLKNAAQRILIERQKQLRNSIPSARNVLDW